MESRSCSQVAGFLYPPTHASDLAKTTMINARTRSGHLQLGLGAGLEERKDAVLRLFHIDRCSLLVRSIGRGRAVKAGKTMDVHDVLYFIT